MNAYEITLIVRPDLDDEQTRTASEQITGRLEAAGGEIIASYPWSPARRRMAYPIRDFGDGFYFTATFRLDPPALRELENGLKLNTNVLRFLIVQATDQMIRQSQQKMQQAAAAAAAPPPAAATPAAAPSLEAESATPPAPPGPEPEQEAAVEEVLAAQEHVESIPDAETAEQEEEPAAAAATTASVETEE